MSGAASAKVPDVAMNDSQTSVESDEIDPLLALPSETVREGDYFVLVFGDGRRTFGQCVTSKKPSFSPVKINKRSYPTYNLVGLPYGTVLEQGPNLLLPLPDGEGLIPSFPEIPPAATPPPSSAGPADTASSVNDDSDGETDNVRDNRHLVDNNKSQALDQDKLRELREAGTTGSALVQQIIENSSTFQSKTDFSQAKYVAKKQLKYQPRCHLVRCTGATVCEALFQKDSKRIMNLREDTLGQILSYSNVSAGSQVLVWETTLGIVTGALAQRLGGYGSIYSLYTGKQHCFVEMLSRFNLTFAENFSIKWVHSGDVLGNYEKDEEDREMKDREVIKWPCPLQDHTRKYLETMKESEKDQLNFLEKRSNRFARKLTRYSAKESTDQFLSRQSDSLILAVSYDPTETLLALLPHLAPSCPFVVYCEFIEPLSACFLELQRQKLAINLRLSDTWAREYQVLPGRTHPNMNMSQSGGFILVGTKLDPVTGPQELDVELVKEIRARLGGRRGKKPKKNKNATDDGNGKDRKGQRSPSSVEQSNKRQRVEG